MITQDKGCNIKEALHQGFRDGTSKLANRKCFGYDRTIDGTLVINTSEAKIVQWIFESYHDGYSFGKISKALEKHDIPSPTSKARWNREAISKLLSNEKYVGSVLLQKTISKDGFQMKNQGELDRVLIRNHHPTIVSRKLFESIQYARLERSKNVINDPEMKMISHVNN